MSKKNNIKTAEFIISAPTLAQCPDSKMPEYAFVGRSNVGKSSLINMITGRKNLAKTSGTPGKTQLINCFLIDQGWYIVDLPGYGWAKVGKDKKKQWSKNVREYLLGREGLTALFILIDIRHEPQSIDLEFIDWVGKNGIPIILVFTKSDKLTKNKAAGSVNIYKQRLGAYWEELPPVFITSAENQAGREEILDYIYQINKSCLT